MCDGISRGSFLAAAGAAALPAAMGRAAAAELPVVPPGLSAGNRRAAEIAHASRFIRAQYAAVLRLVSSMKNAKLRSGIEHLLADPLPSYAKKYTSVPSRTALRDALAREGFVKSDDPVSGIFPAGTEKERVVQPFWSAPGSAYDSHHSYPGGLLVHELFNSRMSAGFADTYGAMYFGGAKAVDRDTVVAAAFYHDIMKTVVFQFNEDGSLLPELTIAGTGGHHCLSGAEAIVRGHDARFVTVLLSAHAAPSLGDEAKVIAWCRAASMIAGVDPVRYGLLAMHEGQYRLAALPPIEAFVSNLSDHDYVLSVHAMQQVGPRVEALNGSGNPHWWRHEILANTSAIELYRDLLKGENAFRSAVHAAAR